MILELCKGVHCVDLGESFQTHIFLQTYASIQPRTSPVKFAGGGGAAAARPAGRGAGAAAALQLARRYSGMNLWSITTK